MIDEDRAALLRQNTYLKARVAQLEDDLGDLNAQVHRLTQQLERTLGRRAGAAQSGGPIA
jgi:hypothetical protein